MATKMKIIRKPDCVQFTMPNGGTPPHDLQYYQLSGLNRREDFERAETPRQKLYAIGHGISGSTMDAFSDEEVQMLNDAFADFASAAGAAK